MNIDNEDRFTRSFGSLDDFELRQDIKRRPDFYGPAATKLVTERSQTATRQDFFDVVLAEANPRHVCNFARSFYGFDLEKAYDVIAQGKDPYSALDFVRAFPKSDESGDLLNVIKESGQKGCLYTYHATLGDLSEHEMAKLGRDSQQQSLREDGTFGISALEAMRIKPSRLEDIQNAIPPLHKASGPKL